MKRIDERVVQLNKDVDRHMTSGSTGKKFDSVKYIGWNKAQALHESAALKHVVPE